MMINRRQALTMGLGSVAALALGACGGSQETAGETTMATEGTDTVSGSLAIHITGLDYGPGVDLSLIHI